MTRLSKGLLVAALHALIVAGIGAKFLYDRSHYPRVWAETAPYDPDMPIRGRYVNIALLVIADRPPAALKGPGSSDNFRARLEARSDAPGRFTVDLSLPLYRDHSSGQELERRGI